MALPKYIVPFSPPYLHPDALAEVKEVLESGWITTGQKTKALEVHIANFVGIKKVLCLNSATAGMEMMLRWFGVGEGDEVIVPAYTYCATANVVLHCGATPVMADIQADDFCISPQEIERLISPRTKVIMPVDIGGMSCDYAEILAVLEAKKSLFSPNNVQQKQLGRCLILTDAAHSLGAMYQGKPAAQATDIAVFSLHAVKNLTTAEGGAIAFNLPQSFDIEALYQEMNTFSLHGQSKDAFSKQHTTAWEYDVAVAGFKCNLPDILAAVGLAGIKDYAQVLERRKAICAAYTAAFSQNPRLACPIFEKGEKISAYHLYPLRIKGISRQERDAYIQRIFEMGVSVNVHYKPLPLLSLYKNLGYKMEDYPISAESFEREITLPLFYGMTDEQVEIVIEAIQFILKR